MGLFLATREVHTHEADGFPVAYRTDFLYSRAVSTERDLELIPRHIRRLAVAQGHLPYFLLGDMLTTHLHHVRSEDDFVLVVFLVLVEGVIEVDIFDIRRQR